MKKLIAILGMFLYSSLSAIPTPTGTDGLLKVISATPEKGGRFSFIWGAKISQKRSKDSISLCTISSNELDTVWTAEKGNCWIGDIPFGIGFSFSDYLEINLNSAYLVDIMNVAGMVDSLNDATGAGVVSHGLSDMELGIKFTPTKVPNWVSPDFSKNFNIGIYPIISFPIGAEKEDSIPTVCKEGKEKVFDTDCRYTSGGIHRFYTTGEITYGGKLLFSAAIGETPPLVVHLNLGYTEFPGSKSRYSYGFGAEGKYQFFAPFLEIYGWHRGNPTKLSKYDDGGTYISPGLRFETATNMWLTLAMDFRIIGTKSASWDFEGNLPDSAWSANHILDGFGTTPPWRVSLTFSQGFDYMKPPAPKTGTIAGKVMDAEDGKGVRALISFPAFDTTVTTDTKGNYEIELPIGKALAIASPLEKGEYKSSVERTVWVEGGAKQILNFRLESKAKVKSAILTGRIRDKATLKPCLAMISFPETNFPQIQSDTSGIYRTELSAGTYVVRVEKSGYIPWTQPVTCSAGQTTILNIDLNSASQIATIAGKVIDYTSHRGIGGAVISFPNTEIPEIKTEPTTGTYKAEIPAGTHTVKVSADGYIPEGVVIVAEVGKSLIKDFELFKKEEKIVLQGITFEFNSANIRPSSYPVLDNAVMLLKEHPSVRVEIAGHTDWIGSNSYNLNLSQMRAESVKAYLVGNGISRERLIARGYGESQPIADNRTKAGQAQNRRIEFRPLSQ